MIDNPEHDVGFRPAHRSGSFMDKRDRRPTAEQMIRKAAEPRRLMAWEKQHGLTVASVSRYILDIFESREDMLS